MLEHEASTIIATLTARTIGTGERIILRDVLAADIPRGIKAYCQTETVRRLSTDLFASPAFSQIDTSIPGVARLSRAFLLSMSEGYTFGSKEFLGLLENAVHFLGNYLCRPQWTIENFAFENSHTVSVNDILAKLDCTVEYAYFKTLIERVARQRGWREIGVEDFRTLLIMIDDQIVKQHNARELALLAKPIFDFVLLRDTPPDAPIPLKPVLAFFEDKKMKILREYIESICRIRERTDITLDELTTLVEDLYLGHTESGSLQDGPAVTSERQEPEPSPAPEAEIARDLMPIEEPTAHIEAPAIFDYVSDDPDGRADEPPADDDDRRSRPGVPSPANAPPSPDTRNLALSLTFAGLSQVPEGAPGLPDLAESIPHQLRVRFIKRLFGKDARSYEDTIAALNGAGTWKDASLLLNKLYREQGLDPFEADVVEFTDAIHRRYRDAESEGA